MFVKCCKVVPFCLIRVRVVGLDNLWSSDSEVIYVEAGLYHGGELLGTSKFSSEALSCTYPRWNQWVVFDISVKNLPKAARLCLQVRHCVLVHTYWNVAVKDPTPI